MTVVTAKPEPPLALEAREEGVPAVDRVAKPGVPRVEQNPEAQAPEGAVMIGKLSHEARLYLP